ncbi:MAG: undecaprenyl-phosphate glucose phosphotransferase [Candidatus Omnitrophica bacterium]|nr:undecaprenyl-phosphate glucose phosphotransferase [Candidatus Omnitrophota bacterium]
MKKHKKKSDYPLWALAADVTALFLSVVAAYGLRFELLGGLIVAGDKPDFLAYLRALGLIIPVYVLFLKAYGLYGRTLAIRRAEEMFITAKASTFSTVILMSMTFFYRDFSYSRVYLVILWLLSIVFLCAGRYFLIQWQYQRRTDRKDRIRVLVVGANRNTRAVIRWAKNNPHYGHEIIGVLSKDPGHVEKHVEGVAILGDAEQCEDFIDKLDPDHLVLIDHAFSRERITDLVDLCEDRFIEFKVAADLFGLMASNVDVEYLSTVPLLGFKDLPLDDFWNRLLKRTFDIMVAGLMLILGLPFWIVIIQAIKRADGGTIFYTQQRMGRDQKIFNLLKFRTMKPDAEKETGPVWARQDDQRRTKIGEFLRRWNLDELPQLLNVLKGDMSLVGPRPERPHFIQQFRETLPRYMARHKVKAGLTGWAQVHGLRGNTSIRERLKYDLYYMENWSLLLDIEILFMTLSSKAFKNAY